MNAHARTWRLVALVWCSTSAAASTAAVEAVVLGWWWVFVPMAATVAIGLVGAHRAWQLSREMGRCS